MNIKELIKNILRPLIKPFKKSAPVLNKKDIKKLIATPSPIIMEIGAANGDDTLDFLNTLEETATVYAFEPEPKNIAILKERITAPNFHLYEGVVSDTNGELTFNRSSTDNPDDLSFSGSIMKPKNHLTMWDWIHFTETLTVPSTTLDSFCTTNNIDTVDFIWCDVQGAEEKVLLGGKESFEKRVRYFYTEYSNDEQYEGQPKLERILELLPSFEVVQNYGQDILLKNKNL